MSLNRNLDLRINENRNDEDLLQKRSEFENKINGVTKNLQDFKNYIDFLKSLLKESRSRRYRNNNEDALRKKIKKLYEEALQINSKDYDLCLSYFKFCKLSNFKNAALLAIENILKKFSDNPEVWKLASTWYSKDCKDLNSAINIIHKALTIHKYSEILYTEAIELELQNKLCTKIDREKKIKIYVESIFKYIRDFKYHIQILNLLEPHRSTIAIQHKIIERLLELHFMEEIVWHTLAQRERKGLHYDMSDEKCFDVSMYCIEKCVAKYQEGLKKVRPEAKEALWIYYLDCLLELRKQNPETNIFLINTLRAALRSAVEDINLAEKYYLVWAEFEQDDPVNLRYIFDKGTSSLPQSIELWKLRMQFAILNNSFAEINSVLNQAVKTLRAKAAPLWLMAIRFQCLTSNMDVDLTYQEGIKQPKEVSDILKPKYIQWIVQFKGISDTRRVYNKIAVEKPYCKELHLAMAEIESIEIDTDFDAWERVMRLACEQFGKEDVDVWINYINFCRTIFKSESEIRIVYENAVSTLSQLFKSDFIDKYEKLL